MLGQPHPIFSVANITVRENVCQHGAPTTTAVPFKCLGDSASLLRIFDPKAPGAEVAMAAEMPGLSETNSAFTSGTRLCITLLD